MSVLGIYQPVNVLHDPAVDSLPTGPQSNVKADLVLGSQIRACAFSESNSGPPSMDLVPVTDPTESRREIGAGERVCRVMRY